MTSKCVCGIRTGEKVIPIDSGFLMRLIIEFDSIRKHNITVIPFPVCAGMTNETTLIDVDWILKQVQDDKV